MILQGCCLLWSPRESTKRSQGRDWQIASDCHVFSNSVRQNIQTKISKLLGYSRALNLLAVLWCLVVFSTVLEDEGKQERQLQYNAVLNQGHQQVWQQAMRSKSKKRIKKVSTRFDSPRISERSLASRSRQLEWNGKNATICRVGIITNCIKTTFFWHCYKMCNAIVIPAGTAPSLWVSSFLCIFRHFSSFLIIYHISDQSRFWPRTGHCN